MTVVDLDFDELRKRKKLVVELKSTKLDDLLKKCPSLSNTQYVKKLSSGLYELNILPKNKLTPKILFSPGLNDFEIEKVRQGYVHDFEGSVEVYQCAKTKRGMRIIFDEFSASRSAELFKGFQIVESKLRLYFVTNYPDLVKSVTDSAMLRSEGPDHKITQFTLSEFFESFMYIPASDEFIKAQWNAKVDKDPAGVVEVSRLTVLDEIQFPLTVEEITALRNFRNACMHYRIISVQEYTTAVELINRYIRWEAFRELREALSNFADSYRPQIEAIRKAISTLVIPRFEVPKFDIPKITIPKLDIPQYNMPSFNFSDIPSIFDDSQSEEALEENDSAEEGNENEGRD